jgi:hypothetical protein
MAYHLQEVITNPKNTKKTLTGDRETRRTGFRIENIQENYSEFQTNQKK